MKNIVAYVLAGVFAVAGASTIVVALAQDRPGQMWPAKVWIQNRDKEEAIPVKIEDITSGTPLRVQVAGTPSVAIASSTVIETRAARQQWDYRTLQVPSGQDPSQILQAAGTDSWETTGVQFTVQGGTAIVLKRPR